MSRRLLVVAVLVVGLATGGAVAGAVLASRGGGREGAAGAPASGPAGGAGAVDLHPIAGSFRPDGTKLSACRGDQRCFEQAFGNIAYSQGPKAALSLFAKEMTDNPRIEAGCHRIAHVIGSAVLARYHGDVPRAFAAGSSICWSGYYHGILERSFVGVTTEAGLIRAARRVCSSPTLRRDQWLLYQCVHGLGHGLMIATGYDLPFSLHVCDRLATPWDQTSCTGGVYMENVNAANGTAYGGKSPWLKAGDLVYPCDAPVTKGHRLYCYLMVTSRILNANGYDWEATAHICFRVQAVWVATCFQSYGRDADGTTRQDPARVRALCRIAGRFQADCIYGAVRDMTANDARAGRAAVLCARLATRLRARCYEGIGTILGSLRAGTAGRRSACAAVAPARYLDACLRGAGVAASA